MSCVTRNEMQNLFLVKFLVINYIIIWTLNREKTKINEERNYRQPDNIACMLQYVINLEVNESIATMV